MTDAADGLLASLGDCNSIRAAMVAVSHTAGRIPSERGPREG